MTATTHIVRGCPSTTGNDRQLNTTTLIRHAARTHGDQEIVYRTPDGGWDRYTMPTATRASAAAPMRCARSVSSPATGSASWTGTADVTSSCTGLFPAWVLSCCR